MELSARVKMEVWSIRNVRRGTTSSLNMKIRLKNFLIRISLMRVEKKIKWAVNMYEEWRGKRMVEVQVASEIRNADLAFVKYFSKVDLCYSLSRFITEVKKLDKYRLIPGKTLREIVIMVQMHLHQNGVYWKLLDDPEFRTLRNILEQCYEGQTFTRFGN